MEPRHQTPARRHFLSVLERLGRAGGRLPPLASMRQVQRSISSSRSISSAATVATGVVVVVMTA